MGFIGIMVVNITHISKPNNTLKRDAPFRGDFGGLLFFSLRWLRQPSVKGAPLSFTLELHKDFMATIKTVGELTRERMDRCSNSLAKKYLLSVRAIYGAGQSRLNYPEDSK